MRNLSIRWKLALGYIIAFLMCLGMLTAAFVSLSRINGYFDEAVSISTARSPSLYQELAPLSEEAHASYDRATKLVVIEIVVLVAAGVLFVRITRLGIVPPLMQIGTGMKALASGDLSAEVSYTSKDELGQTCDCMRTSLNSLRSYIAKIDEAMQELSDGNFSMELKNEFVGDFENIGHSIDTLSIKMSDVMREIQNAAEQVSSGASQLAVGAQSLSEGTTEQAASVEELSATLDGISDQVKDTAKFAMNSVMLTTKVGESIHDCNGQMKELMAAIKDIATTSDDIGKIVKTIDDIAFQTNILALNAAVEAARAGDAGKGFAVVADEVRNLAQKSSEAAQSTATLIDKAVSSANKGNALASITGDAFEAAAKKVSAVVEIVTKIAKAAEDQSTSIEQVTLGVSQISDVVQTNSATSEESAAASEELHGQAQLLNELIARFRLRGEAGAASHAAIPVSSADFVDGIESLLPESEISI
ncbi:MAG: HAMP domain-containing methyl-accepting chemotaxis protein [Clostridia bacterium]|nr:HAMP domain-containing methyl-accepting chemotaxis protein [Clostridia bacterium]